MSPKTLTERDAVDLRVANLISGATDREVLFFRMGWLRERTSTYSEQAAQGCVGTLLGISKAAAEELLADVSLELARSDQDE